jgi:hypothetical protein
MDGSLRRRTTVRGVKNARDEALASLRRGGGRRDNTWDTVDGAAPATHIENNGETSRERRRLRRMTGLTFLREVHTPLPPLLLLGVSDIIGHGAMNIGMEVSGHSII